MRRGWIVGMGDDGDGGDDKREERELGPHPVSLGGVWVDGGWTNGREQGNVDVCSVVVRVLYFLW
jgi:hypothetical protein